MTYPLNEQSFVEKWLQVVGEPDQGDQEQAEATVKAINRAYYAGVRAGREKEACRIYRHDNARAEKRAFANRFLYQLCAAYMVINCVLAFALAYALR